MFLIMTESEEELISLEGTMTTSTIVVSAVDAVDG